MRNALTLLVLMLILAYHDSFSFTSHITRPRIRATRLYETNSLRDLPPLPKKGTSPALCPFSPECGCDGTGKMQGGIATWPLFTWWPIKVFRPCPSYVKGRLIDIDTQLALYMLCLSSVYTVASYTHI